MACENLKDVIANLERQLAAKDEALREAEDTLIQMILFGHLGAHDLIARAALTSIRKALA